MPATGTPRSGSWTGSCPARTRLIAGRTRTGHTGPMATKIILDVDTGTDDAVALMTAALSPDIELVGATIVNGNTNVDSCTENTLRVFDWIGMPEVPVYRGMSRPLARPQGAQRNPATRIHGDLLDLPPSTAHASSRGHAVDWLIETYLASDGDITLVPVGPLTNIATAIQKEPRIVERDPGDRDHGRRPRPWELDGVRRVQHLARSRGGPHRRQLRPADPDGPARRHPPGAGLEARTAERAPRPGHAGRRGRRPVRREAHRRLRRHPADASRPARRRCTTRLRCARSSTRRS